jgi:hypothetical protein
MYKYSNIKKNDMNVNVVNALESNYGNDWTITTAPSNLCWSSVAISSTGQYQGAAASGRGIYLSSNYGNDWTITTASNLYWSSVVLSSTG